ncbi:uncharacterized protein LOC135501074 [Lineus longissimus]|uniref:uncharacterized protein LOC135501074 n=1 Tax=Lineus longissimus TaxID=88925 RepID=UPI002B4DDE06
MTTYLAVICYNTSAAHHHNIVVMKLLILLAFVAFAYSQEAAVKPATTKPGSGAQIGKDILGAVGKGLDDIVGGIKEEMDKDSSKWIKDALAGSSNSAILLELYAKIKSGEIVVPSRKRGLPTKEELLAKLTDTYEHVKETINDGATAAERLFKEALAKLKDAYGKVLENEKVKNIEAKVKEAIDALTAKAKEIAGIHKRESQVIRTQLHKRLVEHLYAHLSPEMSERAARSIGSVIDAAIAKLEEKIQAIVAKFGDKSAEFKEKYLDPLQVKFEEIKNSPAVQEKLQILDDLYMDVKNLANQLISGGIKKRSIGSAIDSVIARVEARIRLLAEKLQDKYSDAKERFLDPLLAKLEELKNSPAVQDKVTQIWQLLDEAKERARNLLFGESRTERSIGSAIDAAIAKVEEKLQLIAAKVNDKTGEIKAKYIDPLIARFEELKNSPAISEKIQGLRDVYADVKDLAKKLLFGEDHEITESL